MGAGNTLSRIDSQIRQYQNAGLSTPPSLVDIQGYSVLFKNTINLIQGQYGSHKSRFAEHLAGILINNNSRYLTKNGFIGKEACKVIYVDTERSIKYNLPQTRMRISNIAGYYCTKTSLHLTSLIRTSKSNRLVDMVTYIDDISKFTNKHIVIVIDVVSDLVFDFNNQVESSILIGQLTSVLNELDCTVVCVIHENPGHINKKARGHLGSELLNKATNVFKVKEERDSLC